MKKYDLSSPLAITAAVEPAKMNAQNEPDQESYNAAWLYGYASALQETSEQLKPLQKLIDAVLQYIGEHNDSSQLYKMFHEEIGLSNEEIEFLGFDLAPIRDQQEMSALEPEKAVLSANIKNWYLSTYPTDTLGEEIREGLTFDEALQTLQNGACIYEALGVFDSVVRERVFDQLAKINNVSYKVIYDMWCDEKIPFMEQLQSASDKVAHTENSLLNPNSKLTFDR